MIRRQAEVRTEAGGSAATAARGSVKFLMAVRTSACRRSVLPAFCFARLGDHGIAPDVRCPLHTYPPALSPPTTPYLQSVEMPQLGVTLEIPKQIALANVALWVQQLRYQIC